MLQCTIDRAVCSSYLNVLSGADLFLFLFSRNVSFWPKHWHFMKTASLNKSVYMLYGQFCLESTLAAEKTLHVEFKTMGRYILIIMFEMDILNCLFIQFYNLVYSKASWTLDKHVKCRLELHPSRCWRVESVSVILASISLTTMGWEFLVLPMNCPLAL